MVSNSLYIVRYNFNTICETNCVLMCLKILRDIIWNMCSVLQVDIYQSQVRSCIPKMTNKTEVHYIVKISLYKTKYIAAIHDNFKLLCF